MLDQDEVDLVAVDPARADRASGDPGDAPAAAPLDTPAPNDACPGPGRLVAVANLKGGTGKSTIAVNLACLAARDGSVLLVDADPQGTAAAWLEPGTVPAGLVVETWQQGADPAGWAERLFAAARHHARIVVDMPPELGPGLDAALGLVDALVIPVTPSAIDLRATAKTLQRVKQVQKERGGRPVCLLVPNRVDQRTAVGRAIQQALRDLDLEVAPPIAQRAGHASAFAARQWIGAHAAGSPALREMAAVAAKLEALLGTAPANDYCPAGECRLAVAEVLWGDDLVAIDALPPDDDCAVAARRRAVDTAPLPPGLALEKSITADGEPSEPATCESRRPGWLASLLAGFRLLGRQHTG